MLTRYQMYICTLLLALVLSACGNDNGAGVLLTDNLGGKVVQAPVAGATVFLDKIGSGKEYEQDDQNEWVTYSTVSADDGTWSLATPPATFGKYRVVSLGGSYSFVDESGLTVKVAAMTMSAPAGAKNVTPLTTLVELQPTPELQLAVQQKLEKLGIASYDIDISQATATPAALLLSKSVETVVATLTNAINVPDSAGITPLSAPDLAKIQQIILLKIATGLQESAVDLTSPDKLKVVLQDSAAVAVAAIVKAEPAITLNPAQAGAVVKAIKEAVAAVAASVPTDAAGHVSTDSANVVSETTLFTPTALAKIEDTVEAQAEIAALEFSVTYVEPKIVYPTVKVTGWEVARPIQIVFNRAMNRDSLLALAGLTVKLVTSGTVVAGKVSYDETTLTAYFTPASPFGYLTTYRVELAGIKDSNGHALPSTSIPTFQTVEPITGSGPAPAP